MISQGSGTNAYPIIGGCFNPIFDINNINTDNTLFHSYSQSKKSSKAEFEQDIIDFIYSYNAEDLSKKKIQAMSSHQRDQYLKKIGFRVVNYDYENRLENAFLTEKACEEHIRINKHNLRQPQSYLSHAFRNPELEQVLSFICQLTGGQLHK